MKGLCIEVSPKGAVFQIDGEQPLPGFYYLLEDATNGTNAQNKAFHALLNAFYFWMARTDQFQFEDDGKIYDLRTPSAGDFREFFKYKYGAGASHYQYVDDDLSMKKAKTLDEIPKHILTGDIEGPNAVLAALRRGIDRICSTLPEMRDILLMELYLPVKELICKKSPDGKSLRIKAVLKSWSDYTKKERQKAIDQLLIIISAAECTDKKVLEIIEGMTDNVEKVKQVFAGEEMPR